MIPAYNPKMYESRQYTAKKIYKVMGISRATLYEYLKHKGASSKKESKTAAYVDPATIIDGVNASLSNYLMSQFLTKKIVEFSPIIWCSKQTPFS
jgi:hypothetical protein